MSGNGIKNAIDNVATAVKETDGGSVAASAVASAVGTMGIRSEVVRTIMNMSAMALLGVVMWVQFRENAAQSKYDREMFRDELKALRQTQVEEAKMTRSAQELRWEKTDLTHNKSMEKMGATIERAVSSMEDAVKELRSTSMKIRPAVVPPED